METWATVIERLCRRGSVPEDGRWEIIALRRLLCRCRACDSTRRTQAWNLDNVDVAIVNRVGVRGTGTALYTYDILISWLAWLARRRVQEGRGTPAVESGADGTTV